MTNATHGTSQIAATFGFAITILCYIKYQQKKKSSSVNIGEMKNEEQANKQPRQQEQQQQQQKPLSNEATPEQALGLIQKRRSIFPKQYTGETVPKKIILEMLEAARWAPTHKITQPWKFIIMESKEAKESFGRFNAEHYKKSSSAKNEFNEKKYNKKMKNALISSHVIAICVNVPAEKSDDGAKAEGEETKRNTMKLNPEVEEICSTAMAVQNMHLVATAYNVGAYWSSSGIYETKKGRVLQNPDSLREFLQLEKYENESGSKCLCLGWLFVGEFAKERGEKKWPQGRRTPLDEGEKFVWQ